MGDALGDRMKENYEDRARFYLTRRVPVIVRVDGRAFHTYTRDLKRPFDDGLADCMAEAATRTALDMQGCQAVYLQSDEASFLLTDTMRLSSGAWFDYNKSKVETIAAAGMTAHFNALMDRARLATFDARAFNVPREEVANYFLWRMKDWARNSVAMLCREHFSHKAMNGAGRADQHELLHSVGVNWATDLEERWRNGTWLIRRERTFDVRTDVMPTFADIDTIVSPLIEVGREP